MYQQLVNTKVEIVQTLGDYKFQDDNGKTISGFQHEAYFFTPDRRYPINIKLNANDELSAGFYDIELTAYLDKSNKLAFRPSYVLSDDQTPPKFEDKPANKPAAKKAA